MTTEATVPTDTVADATEAALMPVRDDVTTRLHNMLGGAMPAGYKPPTALAVANARLELGRRGFKTFREWATINRLSCRALIRAAKAAKGAAGTEVLASATATVARLQKEFQTFIWPGLRHERLEDALNAYDVDV